MTSVPFTDARWVPLTKEHHLKGKIDSAGTGLKHATVGGTDWWRTTERDSKDGPTIGFRRPVGKGFEVSVELDVQPKTQVSEQWMPLGVLDDRGHVLG